MNNGANNDHTDMVVVPSAAGPLVRLAELGGGDDEIEVVLDVFFGEANDSGPSATDVALMAGGAGAVVASQAASLPLAVTVVGAGAFGLGAILPFQSMGRKIATRRHRSKLQSLIGDGVMMRSDTPEMARIVKRYESLLAISNKPRTAVPSRALDVAHTLIYEVATLLDGQPPSGPDETDYVTARVEALAVLASAATKTRAGRKEAARRQALLAARREVDEVDGQSSLTEAATLAANMLDTDG